MLWGSTNIGACHGLAHCTSVLLGVSQLAWQYVTYCVTWPSAGSHIPLHVFMPRPLQAYPPFMHDTCFAPLDILGQGLSGSALCCYPPTLTF